MSERVKRFLHDLAIPAIIVAAVVDIIVVLKFLLSDKTIQVLIEYASWPVLLGVFILLFREYLSHMLVELPEFIRRSYYRHGGEVFREAQEGAKRVGDMSDDCVNKETRHSGADDLKTVTLPKDGSFSLCEPRWVERLQKEYGVPVLVNRSIGVSNYYFDAVMEYQGHLYGIDICGSLCHCNLGLIFSNVQKAYDGFTPEYRKRFIFMICITSGGDDDYSALRDIAKKYDFSTVIKSN